MNLTRILTRSTLALAVVTLAACQTPAVKDDATAAAPASGTTAADTQTADQSQVQPAAAQGAPVAVFLADMVMQDGWRAIPIGSDSTLYLDPQPVVTRDDLSGVQAGSNQQGQGLLALMLDDNAKARVAELTGRNPNKRLALVVGRTLMAAPAYTDAVTTGQLIFPVGTEENATAAARAIAGVSEGEPSSAPAGDPAGSAPGLPNQ